MEVSAVQFSNSSPVQDHSAIKWPKCTKTYNSRWETDPLLKTWISRHPKDIGKVVCSFCQSVIRAHKNDLLEHTRTLKHQRNFMAHATPEEYNQFVMELNELRKDAQLMTKKKVGQGVKSGQSNSVSNSVAHVSVNGVNASVNWTSGGRNGLTLVTPLSHVVGGVGVLVDGQLGTCPPPQTLTSISSSSGNVSMDIWPSETIDNDSFLSADSPSDLVSVILEEQEQEEGDGEEEEEEETRLSANGNSNESLPPTLTPNHLASSSPPGQGQGHHSLPLPLSLQSSASSTSAQGMNSLHNSNSASNAENLAASRPFTASDVIAAIEDKYFSTSELWNLAKCALGIIESSTGGRRESNENTTSVHMSSSNHLSMSILSNSHSPTPSTPAPAPDIQTLSFTTSTTFPSLNSLTASPNTTPATPIIHNTAPKRPLPGGGAGRRKRKRSKLPESEDGFSVDGLGLDGSGGEGGEEGNGEGAFGDARIFPLITFKMEG